MNTKSWKLLYGKIWDLDERKKWQLQNLEYNEKSTI